MAGHGVALVAWRCMAKACICGHLCRSVLEVPEQVPGLQDENTPRCGLMGHGASAAQEQVLCGQQLTSQTRAVAMGEPLVLTKGRTSLWRRAFQCPLC